MRTPRASWLSTAAAVSFAALLAVFAIGLIGAQHRSRHSLEAGFAERAKISAALTSSLFEASASASQRIDTKLYGGAQVARSALTAAARQAKETDMMVLAGDGHLLAYSANTPAAVRREVEGVPGYVRAALAGQPFSLSNVMTTGHGQTVAQYAQPFQTSHGRRVLVAGFAPRLLQGFIAGYLAGTTTAPGIRAFVLDGNGLALASAAHNARPPSPASEPGLSRVLASRAAGAIGHDRYFALAPIRHSPWRVVVTTPQSKWFATVEGLNKWLPWTLFGAFACMLALVLALGARALRGAARQRERDAQFRAVAAEKLGLAAITETMAEGVAVTRASDLAIVYTNATFDTMLGYERDELNGQSITRLKPEGRRDHLTGEVADEVRRTGKWRGEVQSQRKDGSLIWCLANVATLEHPEHGTVWITVHSDISDRKRIESELERATAKAIEASRSKSQFVANMSHEIRTPLNGVIGMTELLRDTDLDPVQRDYADALATSGEALLAVISDVLDFSKIEAGRLELDPTDFDLRNSVEEACQILAEEAHAKRLEISHWIEPEVPVAVRGDRARLRQILLNLISNAVKFTDHGEVSVRVRREGTELVRFAVSDTGVGIEPAQAARLFEAFVQGDQSTTRQYGGTGLGLAIASQLAGLMGGEIGAEPREGGGSTFWFTVRLPEVASAAELPRANPELRGLRALVVDDNPTNRTILSHYLRNWGLESESVDRPSAALAAIERASRDGQSFELALLDFNMPEMNGLELAHEIRGLAPLGELKIIVLSSAPLERKPFAGAEVSAFFAKPARQSELHDAIVAAVVQAPALETAEPLAATIHRLRGPVVLIAEDNEINLALARALLHKRGLQTAAARNGREAVEMASAQSYAAILMDCQMPELDGYEATRQIRENENGHRVPIIAMTAHSMSGDRERCLAAGMDDYIPKPIRTAQLEGMIARWLPGEEDLGEADGRSAEDARNGHGDGARSGDGDGAPNGDRVLDEATVAQLKQVLTPEMRSQLLETFETQLDSCVEEIASAIQRGDGGDRRRVAHLLKGSSATIGAARLRAACQRLERTGRAEDPAVGEEQLAELRDSAAQARRELHEQLL